MWLPATTMSKFFVLIGHSSFALMGISVRARGPSKIFFSVLKKLCIQFKVATSFSSKNVYLHENTQSAIQK